PGHGWAAPQGRQPARAGRAAPGHQRPRAARGLREAPGGCAAQPPVMGWGCTDETAHRAFGRWAPRTGVHMTESQTVEAPPTTAEDAVEIEKIVPKPLDKVWECLLTEAGIEALLGEGARLGTKGEPWHAADGTYGVTRSYHPLEQV